MKYLSEKSSDSGPFEPLKPAEMDVTTPDTSSCTIFGWPVSGVVCGCGLTLLGLFLVLLVVSSVSVIVKGIYRKCTMHSSSLSGFRRKVAQYLGIPVGKLPTCLLLHLYDSLGSERFQTWRSLATIHDIHLNPNITIQNANAQILSELVLKEIVQAMKHLFTLDVLLTDLVELHREDTAMRLTKHLERCLSCTEYMTRYVKTGENMSVTGSTRLLMGADSLQSLGSVDGSVGSSVNDSTLLIHYGGGKLVNGMDPFDDSPVSLEVDMTFWEKYGNTPIIQGEPFCIMERVYSFFMTENCNVLRQFYGLKRWPDRPHFLRYLESRDPAKKFFTAFLCKRPQYTYSKLKRDLERLQQHFIVRDIAQHYNTQECPYCSELLSSSETPTDNVLPKWQIGDTEKSAQGMDSSYADSGVATPHTQKSFTSQCNTVIRIQDDHFQTGTKCDVMVCDESSGRFTDL